MKCSMFCVKATWNYFIVLSSSKVLCQTWKVYVTFLNFCFTEYPHKYGAQGGCADHSVFQRMKKYQMSAQSEPNKQVRDVFLALVLQLTWKLAVFKPKQYVLFYSWVVECKSTVTSPQP